MPSRVLKTPTLATNRAALRRTREAITNPHFYCMPEHESEKCDGEQKRWRDDNAETCTLIKGRQSQQLSDDKEHTQSCN